MIEFTEDCTKITAKDELKVLLVSDLHLDNKKCDREFIKRIFDEAVKVNGTILILGDCFDAMGGKFDKRTHKGDIKPEYQEDDYYNRIAADVADFLIPYVDNIGFISLGNHETAVTKRHEHSLLESLKLQVFYKSQKKLTILNEYDGWVWFKFRMSQTKRCSFRMWFTHGAKGNAIMSYGILNTKRRQAVIDADIYVSGHLHSAWSKPLVKEVLNGSGFIDYKECIHLQLGTAKGRGDFEKKHGFDPPNKSFYWIDFYRKGEKMEFIERRVK